MSALVATVLAMLVLDGLWLGLVARGFYRQHLGFLMADQVNWGAAGLFYTLYAIGLTVFVTMPSIDGGSVGTALWRGALFGLVAYATYDLTNQATLKGWPVIVTAVDLAWGMLLSAAVGAIATYAVLRIS
ncbi:MAG TPA: DUF2177 family protein [Candidatus Limnocylindria bacterium]